MRTETIAHDLLCDSHLAERPRYFPRQLITADDMTLEQEYFRNKLRLHNRLLHGWGVVCGAQVCPVPKANGNGGAEPWKAMVSAGYILGPHGDDIVIQTNRIVDLRTQGVTSKSGDPSGELVDPWCSPVHTGQLQPQIYVAVRYKEIMTRPVRVQPVGCGCDETPCEYSRFCDGYEIGLLPRRPDSDQQPPLDNLADLVKAGLHNCPPCPPSPWVVLAEVRLAEDGTITEIDNCSCRRMVLSFAHAWWRSEGGKIENISVTVSVGGLPVTEVEHGQTAEVSIMVSGAHFRSEAGVTPKVSLGSGVTIGTVNVGDDGDSLTLSVFVTSAAPLGPRTLTIINPDCSMASMPHAMIIIPQRAVRPLPPPVEHLTEEPRPTPPTPSVGEAARPRRRTRPRGER